jgi:hypothetical protein
VDGLRNVEFSAIISVRLTTGSPSRLERPALRDENEENHPVQRLRQRNALSRQRVKADMMATVAFARLDLIRTGRDPFGKRKYLTPRLEPAQIKIVYQCVLHAIGLSGLTSGLD